VNYSRGIDAEVTVLTDHSANIVGTAAASDLTRFCNLESMLIITLILNMWVYLTHDAGQVCRGNSVRGNNAIDICVSKNSFNLTMNFVQGW